MINLISLIANVPCFSEFTFQQIAELVELTQKVSFGSGVSIVKENDLIDSVFIIVEGSAEVIQNKQLVAVLKPGESIGLSQIGFYSTTGFRTATVIAQTPVIALKLPLNKFVIFLQKYSQLNELMAHAAKRMLQMRLIKHAAPFTALSTERIQWIADRIETRTVTAGQIIFNEGDTADGCYLIESGAIEILALNENGSEHILATLKKPAIFGEAALLTNSTRNASARAKEDSKLLLLSKGDFLELTQQEKTTSNIILNMMVDRTRPLAKANITVHSRQTDDAETIITLKDPEQGEYYQLSAEGLFVWQQLNGQQTLQEITAAFHKKFAVVAPEAIFELVADLIDSGFIETKSLSTQLNQITLPFWTKALLKIRDVMEAQWAIHNVDVWLTNAYKNWAKIFFNRTALWLVSIFIVLGLTTFIAITPAIALKLPAAHHLVLLLVGSFIISSFTIFAHELSHAFATKSFNHHVYRMGVGWYWLGPIAFTDTSDMWLANRKQRTAVNIAGILNDCAWGSCAAFLSYFSSHVELSIFFWIFALSQFIGVLKNLNPLLEYDGYYILMDLLEKPHLRETALIWLMKPTQWRSHKAELIYWLVCITFLVLTAYIAYLLQVFFIGTIIPTNIFGISSHHFRWIIPLLAIIISSLGIYAEIKRHEKLATKH